MHSIALAAYKVAVVNRLMSHNVLFVVMVLKNTFFCRNDVYMDRVRGGQNLAHSFKWRFRGAGKC